MKRGDGFGICLIASGSEVGAAAKPFPVGTKVEIVDWDQEDGGMLIIETRGLQRFRIIESSADNDGLLIGEVEMLPREQKVAIPSDYQSLADLLQRALEQVRPLLAHSESDFTDAIWVSSRLTELLPMPVSDRHDLVAMNDPIERLSVLLEIVEGDL